MTAASERPRVVGGVGMGGAGVGGAGVDAGAAGMVGAAGAGAASAAGALMRAEIAEQPARWLDLATSQRESIDAAAALIREVDPALLVFVARGSSDHAALYGQYLVHSVLGIPAMLATPSTVTVYGAQVHYPRSVMIAVSQSGASPDLLATVESAKRDGVPVIALTNTPGSALATLADRHIWLAAGAERSVAATKTYTAELLALSLLVNAVDGRNPFADVPALAERASSVLAQCAAPVKSLAESLIGTDRFVVVGRGYSMATAKEGALKLMETSAVAASGWSAADATHGPLGQVVPGTAVIAIDAAERGSDSVTAFAAAAIELGGRVVLIGRSAPALDADVAAGDTISFGAAGAAVGGAQVGGAQVGGAQVGGAQGGGAQVGGAQVGGAQGETASAEVGPTQVGSTQVGSVPVGSLESQPLPVELLPLLEILPLQLLALEFSLHSGRNPDTPEGLSKVTRTR